MFVAIMIYITTMLIYFIQLFALFISCLCLNEFDRNKYEEGKKEYSLLETNSKMPRYGICWRHAITSIQEGCQQLTDVVQSRLALAYLNCFLELQGRPAYPCSEHDALSSCTNSMRDADQSIFATFFTHTHNICYFLQSQVWQEETEKTIQRLSLSSEEVASQLEESSELQHKVIQQQNISLENQNLILDKAHNLSKVINSSSANIHGMFDEFKKSTKEQRMLINDVFERVSKLQSTIIGEFSGFYTLVFYTLMIIICYLLTSTPRTSKARFWLFGLMTVNLVLEKLVLSSVAVGTHYSSVIEESEQEDAVYRYQWLCRKVSASVGLLVLLVSAYRYHDINVINNRLLMEIKKQNAEIKQFLQGNVKSEEKTPILATPECIPEIVQVAASDSTGYESGAINSATDIDMVTATCSPAVKPDDDSDSIPSETSFSTALTTGSRSSRRSLQRELRALRTSTPFHDLTEPLMNWATTGFYTIQEGGSDSVSPTSSDLPMTASSAKSPGTPTKISNDECSPGSNRYCLRKRTKSTVSEPNLRLKSESAGSFTKKVKHLGDIARKNSRMARQTVKHEDMLPASSDDDH